VSERGIINWNIISFWYSHGDDASLSIDLCVCVCEWGGEEVVQKLSTNHQVLKSSFDILI